MLEGKEEIISALKRTCIEPTLNQIHGQALDRFSAGKFKGSETFCWSFLQSLILNEQHVIRDALPFFQRAILLESGSFNFHLILANLRDQLGHSDKARRS